MFDTVMAFVMMADSSFGVAAAILEAVHYVTAGVGMSIYNAHSDESV